MKYSALLSVAIQLSLLMGTGIVVCGYSMENPPVVLVGKNEPKWVMDPTMVITVKGVYGKASLVGDVEQEAWKKALKFAKKQFAITYPEVDVSEGIELGRYHNTESNEVYVWFGVKIK